MLYSLMRGIAVFVAVFGLLVGVVWLNFGYEPVPFGFLQLFVVGVALVFLVRARHIDRWRRAVAIVVALGLSWLWYDSGGFLIFLLIAGMVLVHFLPPWNDHWRRRLTAVAVILGCFVFGLGVYGGTIGCNAAGYPSSADYGVTYDWSENVLRFGDNIDGTSYRCQATPNRAAAVAGYLLTSVGVFGGLWGWNLRNGPFRARPTDT